MADTCHNTPGLPGETLSAYIHAQQSLAIRVRALSEALEDMILNRLDRHKSTGELASMLVSISGELVNNLDCTSLPKGDAA